MFNYNLFARPNFLSGMSRAFDIGGTLNQYNYSASPEEADRTALMSDWLAVGLDLQGAMVSYEQSSKATGKKQK